jgi:hypothetical protein
MNELIKRALNASRESKRIEFKRGFEDSAAFWCELIKDIVALANSGGGIIVFGLNSNGEPSGDSVDSIAAVDPADLGNKLSRYIASIDFEIEGLNLKKRSRKIFAFLISAAPTPHVFKHPGTYDIGGGKQKSAFGVGTIYFRHGAKSEPATTEDIRFFIERAVQQVRKSWISGVRQVVQAPLGTEIVAVKPTMAGAISAASSVRMGKDFSATPIRVTRDPSIASGTIYYEEIAEGIFEEINNVIDANRALAKGKKRFFLGAPIYYRIYAERQHVLQQREAHELLLRAGVVDFYAPALFWMLNVSPVAISEVFTALYKDPISPQIHTMLRLAVILGDSFSRWLLERMSQKWGSHPQPPTFYWTFKSMVQDLHATDYRLRCSRFSTKSRIELPGSDSVDISELLENPSRAAAILSQVCVLNFEGKFQSEGRTLARNLDYLAYAALVRERAEPIATAIASAVGDQQFGEVMAETEQKEPGETTAGA